MAGLITLSGLLAAGNGALQTVLTHTVLDGERAKIHDITVDAADAGGFVAELQQSIDNGATFPLVLWRARTIAAGTEVFSYNRPIESAVNTTGAAALTVQVRLQINAAAGNIFGLITGNSEK